MSPGQDILLVEDNPDDIALTREAFRVCGQPYRLHVVEDGIEALAFLRRESSYNQAPRPDLVLLDLNLPKISGHEVLAEIRADDALCTIPVVVLTSSAAEPDIHRSHELAADGFVTKSASIDEFFQMVRDLNLYCRRGASEPDR